MSRRHKGRERTPHRLELGAAHRFCKLQTHVSPTRQPGHILLLFRHIQTLLLLRGSGEVHRLQGGNHTFLYSRTSLVRTPGDRQNAFALSEFILTNIICIEKALKWTEIVFVLTVFLLTRFYCMPFT